MTLEFLEPKTKPARANEKEHTGKSASGLGRSGARFGRIVIVRMRMLTDADNDEDDGDFQLCRKEVPKAGRV